MIHGLLGKKLGMSQLFDEQGNVVTEIEPSGQVARVKTEQIANGEINGVPVVRTRFIKVEGLPEPEKGKVFIVSTLVAQAVKRNDVIAPDTSPQSVVRDENGRIIGVKRFQSFWKEVE